MKKITFLLFALISGSVFSQDVAATAETFAEIVEPLKITKSRDLNFGRIIGGDAGGGVVEIAANETGERTIDNDLNAPGGTVTSAQFEITASDYTYEVIMNASNLIAVSGGGTDMELEPLNNFTDNENIGDQNLYVGGKLTVGTNQAAGNYEGTVEVTVSYQ